jgi:hypothetical protein
LNTTSEQATLNRDDPLHVALVMLAMAASKLVDDLHDYQHWLGAGDSELFSLRDVDRDYEDVTLAYERFRAAMAGAGRQRVPPGDER